MLSTTLQPTTNLPLHFDVVPLELHPFVFPLPFLNKKGFSYIKRKSNLHYSFLHGLFPKLHEFSISRSSSLFLSIL